MASQINLDGLMKEYDKLIDALLKRLRDLISRLYEERREIYRMLEEDAASLHHLKNSLFQNEKQKYLTAMDERKAEHASKSGFKMSAEELVGITGFVRKLREKEERIAELEKELQMLLEQDIKLTEQETITLKSEQSIISGDLERAGKLIDQIEQKVGKKKKFEFKVFGKGRSTILLTPQELKAIYDQIVLIYEDFMKRGQIAKWEKERFEPMKKQIEEKANDLINRLKVVITAGVAPSP